MKIGLFVVTPGRKGGGPETYETGLLRGLAAVDKSNQYFVYCTTPDAVKALNISNSNFTFRVLKPESRWLSVPFSLPASMLRDRLDVYHATMVPAPFTITPLVLSILCSSNWDHPEFYDPTVLKRLNFLLACGVRQARYMMCISEYLIQYMHARFRMNLNRLRLSYMGVGSEFWRRSEGDSRQLLREKYGIEEPYMVFIGQQQERKNVFRVIEAFSKFKRETRSDTKLLLVGREADTSGPIYDALREHGVLSSVQRIRYIPMSDLPELYTCARMLVFPSLWEGFGLPIVESMACGTPVLTSNTTCLPEVAGDAAYIADSLSIDDIAEGMNRIEFDQDYRQNLVGKGLERAKLFTWAACAQATIDVYRHAASRRQLEFPPTPMEQGPGASLT